MPGQVCKHEGCTRGIEVRGARGMCQKHYDAWRVRNPMVRETLINEKTVRESLPGTIGQLQEATGLSWTAVRRCIDKFLEEGTIHIGDHVPPLLPGHHWRPIYEDGPGEHAKVSKGQRKAHTLAQRKQRYKRRSAVERARSAASMSGGWAATLMACSIERN